MSYHFYGRLGYPLLFTFYSFDGLVVNQNTVGLLTRQRTAGLTASEQRAACKHERSAINQCAQANWSALTRLPCVRWLVARQRAVGLMAHTSTKLEIMNLAKHKSVRLGTFQSPVLCRVKFTPVQSAAIRYSASIRIRMYIYIYIFSVAADAKLFLSLIGAVLYTKSKTCKLCRTLHESERYVARTKGMPSWFSHMPHN